MKVLHFVKTSTGATWALRLMRDLVSMGVEVHVAMPVDGILIPQYLESRIIIHELNYSMTKLIKTIKGIRKVVDEVKPDIVHSHFVLTTLLMRLALRNSNIKRVFEVPGPLHLEHKLFRNADLLTAQKNVDYWIPTCKWSLNKYKECGITDDRLFLAYYGGDLADKEYQKGTLRSELGLLDSDIIVGMVAYMYAPKKYLGEKRGLKGHEDLIDAVALIQDKYPNLHLVIVGGPWAGAAEYEQKVIKYGKERVRNIHFLGTRRNIPELYQGINVVVHPSHTENLGGAAESLMLAIPTISSNVGGFPDIVIDHKTGLLVPPYAPDALADAIEEMINNQEDAKKMALEGQKLVKHMLDAKNTSKDVFNIYKKILIKNN